MDAREVIAKAALLTAVVSRSESERIADAVLAALEAEGIVLCRERVVWNPRYGCYENYDGQVVHVTRGVFVPVPLESLPESEK